MDHEPNEFTPTPRPCSTPHSAPSRWLSYDPGIDPPPEGESDACGSSDAEDLTPEEQRRGLIADFLDAYERSAPEGVRRDGWTPFLRKLFLQTIADTGLTSAACAYTRMSRSAAYALAQRDRVFAAAWDAADQFARRPIADRAREQMLEGITETITRADGTTLTRHRYDTRLTIAVLNRLDKRCDRAEERGSVHLAAMRNWDEFLGLIGKGDDAAAEALLDSPQNRPACPLPERANPIPIGDPPGCDPRDNIWQVGTGADPRPHREHRLPEGTWVTTFPPPPGFDGYQNVPWDGYAWYERTCTADEVALLEAEAAAAEAEEHAQTTAYAEAQRDRFFGRLRAELKSLDDSQRPKDEQQDDDSAEADADIHDRPPVSGTNGAARSAVPDAGGQDGAGGARMERELGRDPPATPAVAATPYPPGVTTGT